MCKQNAFAELYEIEKLYRKFLEKHPKIESLNLAWDRNVSFTFLHMYSEAIESFTTIEALIDYLIEHNL